MSMQEVFPGECITQTIVNTDDPDCDYLYLIGDDLFVIQYWVEGWDDGEPSDHRGGYTVYQLHRLWFDEKLSTYHFDQADVMWNQRSSRKISFEEWNGITANPIPIIMEAML